MDEKSDTDTVDITSQLFNMALENHAIRNTLIGYAAIHVFIIVLLIIILLKLTMFN